MTLQRRPHRLSLDAEFGVYSTQVERLWEQMVGSRSGHPRFAPPVVQPPVDVYYTPDEVVAILEIPGMRGQEVHLEVEPDRLTIRGEKWGRHCPDEHVYSQIETVCGGFERIIQLPAAVDPEGTKLSYDDGYIEIHMPRAARQPGQRLVITVRQS